MTDKKIEKIKNDYMSGLKYKEIQKKNKITNSQLISLIRNNKWKRKSNRSEALKNNKNAVGNKGGPGAGEGNKNAVTTGEYENIYKDVLEDDELKLYENYEINNTEQLLIEQYKMLTIREKRMMKRIKEINDRGKDMTINHIRNEKEGSIKTITDAEPTLNLIQRIEDGLTRVQEAKRRCIDSLSGEFRIKLEIANPEDNITEEIDKYIQEKMGNYDK